MRLTWLDRIRRLVRPRGITAGAAEVSGSQGKHRRKRRRAPGATADRPARGPGRAPLGPGEADQRSGPGPADGLAAVDGIPAGGQVRHGARASRPGGA